MLYFCWSFYAQTSQNIQGLLPKFFFFVSLLIVTKFTIAFANCSYRSYLWTYCKLLISACTIHHITIGLLLFQFLNLPKNFVMHALTIAFAFLPCMPLTDFKLLEFLYFLFLTLLCPNFITLSVAAFSYNTLLL